MSAKPWAIDSKCWWRDCFDLMVERYVLALSIRWSGLLTKLDEETLSERPVSGQRKCCRFLKCENWGDCLPSKPQRKPHRRTSTVLLLSLSLSRFTYTETHKKIHKKQIWNHFSRTVNLSLNSHKTHRNITRKTPRKYNEKSPLTLLPHLLFHENIHQI